MTSKEFDFSKDQEAKLEEKHEAIQHPEKPALHQEAQTGGAKFDYAKEISQKKNEVEPEKVNSLKWDKPEDEHDEGGKDKPLFRKPVPKSYSGY